MFAFVNLHSERLSAPTLTFLLLPCNVAFMRCCGAFFIDKERKKCEMFDSLPKTVYFCSAGTHAFFSRTPDFMRILYILNRIPLPLTDGGAICSYNSVKFLHQAGHQLTLLALNTNKHYQAPEIMQDVCNSIRTVDLNTDIKAVKALGNLFFSRRPYIAERFHVPAFAELICKTLNEQTFDMVHIDQTMIAWYVDAIRARVKNPPPVVLRTHNIEYIIQERLAAHEAHPAKRLYRRFLAKRMKRYETAYYPKFDGVIAITPEEEAMMRGMGYTGTLTAIPAGVDTHEFAPNPDVERFPNTLCYIGGMDWQPNIEAVQWFVNTVFPIVQREQALKRLPSLEFHVAGKRMSPEVQALSARSGVRMFPDVPSAADFLQAREILVVPLLSGGGMRLKIVEAMALGVPIVSTRVGAEGIAVKHGESILFADTPEEFARAILLLHEQPELRKQIAANARIIALERYSWEGIAEQMATFYERVIYQHKQ
jgi:polysaccharide biosynthesis protein PslH